MLALLGVAAVGAAVALSNRDLVTKAKPNEDSLIDEDELHDINVGQTNVQQSLWTAEQFRPLWSGNRAAYQHPRGPLPMVKTNSRLMEDVSLDLTDDYKELMRANIADTECK